MCTTPACRHGRWRQTLIVAALLASPWANAQTKFSGYIKTFGVIQDSVDTPLVRSPRIYESQNSLRLMWQVFEPHTVWQLHYEITPIVSSRAAAYNIATFANAHAWRVSDIEENLSRNPRRQVFQNLDRLNVQFNFKAGDLTIGRQPITFGVARVINPTDVFLPFDVRTLNREYRIGVDAIRFQHPIGPLSEVDAGVIGGKGLRSDDSSAFLQLRTNVAGKDFQFALIRFAGQTLTGGGVQTSIGDFGFWFEAANVTGDEHYVRVSTGLDYAFTENVYGLVEYHFNGAGAGNPAGYLHNLTTSAYRVGGVFLMGREYIIPSVNWQASPLLSLSFKSLANLSDGSIFAAFTASYNVSENAYVDFGYYRFMGGNSTEYGAAPDTLYASLRYYF